MKFATALLALATAAMASPTKLAAEKRSDCHTCDMDHQTSGAGTYNGANRECNNWVPATKDLIALDVHAEICLKAEVGLLGLVSLNADVSLSLDVDIDVALLQQKYPDAEHLFCDDKNVCKKGEKVPEQECWQHEFKNQSD